MDKEMIELATGLQNSNVPEVAKLAKAYLDLTLAYEFEVSAAIVLEKYSNVFKRLKESGD